MAKKKKPLPKNDRLWTEAKHRCRLNSDDIRMAREMGLNPRSLIKNIPSRTEPWKLPVREWIREMYQKRQGQAARKKAREEQAAVAYPVGEAKQLSQDKTACGEDEDSISEEDDCLPGQEQIQDENHAMLRRQEQFRIAAKCVADQLSSIPEVQKGVLFGSVARPLEKEVPRFRKFREAGVAIRHECRDIDMAVWVSDLSRLKAIQKARSQALKDLLVEKQIGVAHHQVDIFVMEPKTNRYLGRLCNFGFCPKGKDECRTSRCGKPKFLRQHEDFKFESENLNERTNVVLFERSEDTN
ncbi:MAG: hypothetical protein ACYTAS_20100 [Planctomycetota bacterium]|jgi:hypothetical protein